MIEKSRWQKELETLPEWAQKLIQGLIGSPCYSSFITVDKNFMNSLGLTSLDSPHELSAFTVILRREQMLGFVDGFRDARDLAAALTAPFPVPAPPARERRVFNVVEVLVDAEGEDDCAFDQPCAYGHRVESHAVYCHNEAWPDSPRKCGRNRTDYRHEDCPGFVANPDYRSGGRAQPR